MWPPVPEQKAEGVVAISASGNTGGVYYSANLPITFPVGLFTAPPFVEFSYEGPGVGWADHGATATTTGGTSTHAFRINAAPSGVVRWRAVGV